MFVRNSIFSLFRTKGKTLLFWILLFVLTLLLGMGFSVWSSIENFLQKCDDFYTSIGVLEYRGIYYPDEIYYDDYMQSELENLDISSLLADKAVKSFEWSDKRLGMIDGLARKDAGVYARNEAVLIIGNIRDTGMDYDGNEVYWASVYDTLYAQEDKTGLLVMIEQDGKYELDTTKTYLAHGEFYFGRSSYPHFRVTEFVCQADKELEASMLAIEEVKRESGKYLISEDSPFYIMADILRVRNNSVIIQSTANVEGLPAFNQELIKMQAGSTFTGEEYEKQSKVCLISERLAGMLGLTIGDSIKLSSVYKEKMDIYQSYLPESGFDESDDYIIKGVFNGSSDYGLYVYIPKNGIEAAMTGTTAGYTIGEFILENSKAADFEQKASELLQGRFRITVYDQGYEVTSRSYYSILTVTRIATALCLIVSLVVIILFGYLFVYRQRETAEIMVLLGTVPKHIVLYFESGAGFIALSATIMGGVLGMSLQDKLMNLILDLAQKLRLETLPYSEMKSGMIRILEFVPAKNNLLFLFIGLGVFLTAFLSILGFVLVALHKKQGQGRKVMQLKPVRKSSGLRGNPFKYTLLSMRRGSLKSILVPVFSFLAIIFMATLVQASNSYKEHLKEVKEKTEVRAYFTDINGKSIQNLLIDSYDVGQLYYNGYIEDLCVEWGTPYIYLTGKSENDAYEETHLYMPNNPYAAETVKAKIDRGSEIIFTNSIKNASEFYFSKEVDVEYLDGYDESFLTEKQGDEILCLLPERYLKEKHISLGDVFKVVIDKETTHGWFYELELKVVGTYLAQGEENTIYCPLSCYYPIEWIWGDYPATGSAEDNNMAGYVSTEDQTIMRYYSFQTVNFTVNSLKLNFLRDYLREYGISEVGYNKKIREFIMIEDKSFLNTVSNLEQQILYTDYLYPVLYVLVIMMGMTVSYLLTTGRRPEMALMRGMGAKRGRILLTFLTEQFLLCGVGSGLAMVVWWIFERNFLPLQLWLLAAFILLYLCSCFISIIKSNYKKLSGMLADKDE